MALTNRVSFIPTEANVGTTYSTASPPAGLQITAANTVTVRDLGWRTGAGRGASMRSNGDDFRLALSTSSVTATLMSKASNVASWWNFDLLVSPGQFVAGTTTQLLLFAVFRLADAAYVVQVELRGISTLGIADIRLTSQRGGTPGITNMSVPFNEPTIFRLHMKQVAGSTWTYDCELLYSTDSGQTWTSAGSLANCHGFNSAPERIWIGNYNFGGGGAIFRAAWGGVVVSEGTVDADKTAAIPVTLLGQTISGVDHYLDLELSGSVGDGSLASPFSLTKLLTTINGTSYFRPMVVYRRDGVDMDTHVYPSWTAKELITEYLAGTLTAHPAIPRVKVLGKGGAKQRIATATIMQFDNPLVVEGDGNGKPVLWNTVAQNTWTQPNIGTYPNIWEGASSARAYLFQDGLPLESSNQANITAGRVWVNGAPGRMWTDGSTMLVYPRNGVNPTTAPLGTFERTRMLSTDSIINLAHQGILRGLKIYGTTIRNSSSDVLYGNYCFGSNAKRGLAIVADMEGDFADKHVSGSIQGATGPLTTLWINNKHGRCSPHEAGTGRYTARVDYTDDAALSTGTVLITGWWGDQDLYPDQSGYPTNGTDVGGENNRSASSWYSHTSGSKPRFQTLRVRANANNVNTTMTTNVTGATVVGLVNGTTYARAWGGIYFSGQPTAGQTITINAVVITFVASAPSGNQVLIGASTVATIANLNTFINANTVALAITSVIQADPFIEHYFGNCQMTAGGPIYPSGYATPMKVEDSTIYGIKNVNNATVLRCVYQSNPFRFGGNINDSLIQYWPNSPAGTGEETRIQDPDVSGAGPFNLAITQSTIDLSGLTVGAATWCFGYSGTLAFNCTFTDVLMVMPNSDIGFVNATDVQVPVAGLQIHIVAPNPSGGGVNFRPAKTLAVWAFEQDQGFVYPSYAAAKVSSTNRKLLGGSPLIGVAENQRTPPDSKDLTRRTFALRNDIGAYEFGGSSVASLSTGRVWTGLPPAGSPVANLSTGRAWRGY